jgi:cyclic pyranopterin phosphate synthase
MMTEDEVVAAVEVAASLGIHKIRLTGGEPLVKRNIVSICRRVAAIEGIKEVCLTTNGVMLPEMAHALKMSVPYREGITEKRMKATS